MVMVMMVVMVTDLHLLGWHRVLLFLAKAGTARPSETKAAKAIANFFMEFLPVVDQQHETLSRNKILVN